MKQMLHFLNIRICPRGQIIIALLLFSAITIAQESTPEEFIVGTAIGVPDNVINNEAMQDTLNALKLNTISFPADNNTQNLVSDYNLIAWNATSELEYIYHYSSSYYSKWEAEQNQTNPERIGFKHYDSLGNTYGTTATWKGKECWSTIGLSAPTDFLMYGPHYRQDKKYKRWYTTVWEPKIQYVVRFNMALTRDSSVQNNEDVCKIMIVFRYKIDSTHYERRLKSRILKVSDFYSDSSFTEIYLHENPDSLWYEYPPEFIDIRNLDKLIDPPAGTISYIDYEEKTGIQYCVEWLRNDSKCTLYIDYIEVYDNDGWNNFIAQPIQTTNKIKAYADSIKTMGFTNIKYWGGVDEPSVIDAFIPVQTVNSILVDSAGAPPLINTFNPTWTWNHLVNGEMQMNQYIDIAKPYEFLLAMNPGSPEPPILSFAQLDWLRYNFQLADDLHPDFWYAAQTHGLKTDPNGEWHIWRKPDPPELKSIVMLSLAHGAKGIIFMWFDSYGDFPPIGSGTYWECIVKEDGTHLNTYPIVKDTLVPRLKGTLGKTLLDLEYTGDFLQLKHIINQQNPILATYDYLTLELVNPSIGDHNWHAGFFSRSQHPLDNYFMIDNLITTDDRKIKVTIDPPYIDDFDNYRFRNVEGLFDTTIERYEHDFTDTLAYTPGEGYLYELAPVVLYGGRLLYPEETQLGMILNNDMIIENGATLTISDTYTANANIIVKNGSIVNGENGTIIFNNGSKLIIEGVATINGISEDKLSLEFNGEDTQYGIIIDSSGSLIMSNCIVEGAETGLKALVDAGNINIQYVDFNDCIASSINILGQTVGSEAVRQIKYCTITNSPIGISASNLPELLIQENDITNTDLGITLSNISRAVVFGNYIISNTVSLQGIFAGSVGGEIRTNFISGHTYGIHLGNSSPDVGGNNITGCKFHGIYVGSGSEPNMVARLIHNPNNYLWYPVSGYNVIYDNGGYEGGGNDNDGSEIYISDNANVIMSEGCNEIVDDREPSGNLVNTLLLMNGDNVYPPIQVEAQYNYWGETEVTVERFGDLDVNFDDWLSESCPLPDKAGEDMLITRTSTGEVIDTLYPSGEVTNPLSEIETLYSSAEGSFITGDYTTAGNYYDQIILIDTSLSVKKEAYTRKYEIGKLLGRETEYFNDIRNTYLGLAQTTSNTLFEKVFIQLSSLSLIGEEEYVPAIGKFDEVIQQNPNSEEAVYAEIDAITTAILIEESDSTLQKGTLGKYLIKPGEDYLSKLDGILRKYFGSGKKETEQVVLPTEYTLYQNFPNPFNPVTTIKYDLPNASDVSIIIYDILGRKVKELVNAKQQAGRYEIQFNASNLASGVYIYQLIADEKYINAKKMILLK